jgi:hypothetical protein
MSHDQTNAIRDIELVGFLILEGLEAGLGRVWTRENAEPGTILQDKVMRPLAEV